MVGRQRMHHAREATSSVGPWGSWRHQLHRPGDKKNLLFMTLIAANGLIVEIDTHRI
jgi:hypothetical protein